MSTDPSLVAHIVLVLGDSLKPKGDSDPLNGSRPGKEVSIGGRFEDGFFGVYDDVGMVKSCG